MKRIATTILGVMVCLVALAAAKVQTLSSPDGKLRVEVNTDGKLSYNVFADGEAVLTDATLALKVGNETLGVKPKLRKAKRGSINEDIKREVPYKNAVVGNHCNTLTLNMAGNYSVEFRAYNNGIAYRFVLKRKGNVNITDEDFTIHFPTAYKAHISKVKSFRTSCEERYAHLSTTEYADDGQMTYLPVLFESPSGYKVLFSEANLRDYPGMFLKSTGDNGVTSIFPKVPLEFGPEGDRSVKIVREADYIAATSGTRTLPWRFFVISKDDRALVENEMVYILSDPCEIADCSWIKPGQVSWDWWNGWNLIGVDFRVGINTETYKYWIDFASKYGIPYIIMDEGWSKSTRDPWDSNPDIDLPALISYGKFKNVGIVLWLTWLTVENNFKLFAEYEKWGIAGVKIDFMDRSDQWMVNFYERAVKEAAKHHLFVDFHGAYKPSGLERRYPNLLSYEGVRGLEQQAGCSTDNTIYLPFMRGAVGPMDFTPGAMFSAHPEHMRSVPSNPMGMGTRAYQMALYVVFESGVQMLADSPISYMKEDECTRFITQVPTTWDELKVLDAKVGEYVVVARRKGSKWFIGAIANDKRQEVSISLDFLKGFGTLTSFEDGINADRNARDYKKRVTTVDATTRLDLKLERDGGWCGMIEEHRVNY